MFVSRRISKKELSEVVKDYHSALPDWLLFEKTALYRERFPVRQTIWFQQLRTGAYRPMHGISALPITISGMLPQTLDVRNREASLTQHASRWRNMVQAMDEQFKPDIRRRLDIAAVLALCEAEARPQATNDLAMLAVLYAWLDRKPEALAACGRMQSTPLPTLAPIPEWEAEMKAFGRSLAEAVQAGTAREFLEAAAQQARGNLVSLKQRL